VEKKLHPVILQPHHVQPSSLEFSSFEVFWIIILEFCWSSSWYQHFIVVWKVFTITEYRSDSFYSHLLSGYTGTRFHGHAQGLLYISLYQIPNVNKKQTWIQEQYRVLLSAKSVFFTGPQFFSACSQNHKTALNAMLLLSCTHLHNLFIQDPLIFIPWVTAPEWSPPWRFPRSPPPPPPPPSFFSFFFLLNSF